jgi:predicted kinase
VAEGLYGDDATRATYLQLAATARVVAAAGHTAILDATFLGRRYRSLLREVAASEGVPIAMVDVHAPECVLRERIAARAGRATDPSEATLAVLERQFATAEPLAPDEDFPVVTVDGRAAIEGTSVAALVHCLFGPTPQPQNAHPHATDDNPGSE